jgi:hypothetical protein
VWCRAGGVCDGRAGPKPKAPDETAVERHRALTWAARLKRVFAIEINRCRRCGGKLRVIASIEDEATITRILDHLGGNEACESLDAAHPSRAPPEGTLPL